MSAVQRALALDPQSAEGQEALGRAQFLFDWNFPVRSAASSRPSLSIPITCPRIRPWPG
jgi:hypothetical protein